MRKGWSATWLWLGASAAGLAGELTPTEVRWLQGVAPVVAYAKENRIPLDIVVQPQDAPNHNHVADHPLRTAHTFRCKVRMVAQNRGGLGGRRGSMAVGVAMFTWRAPLPGRAALVRRRRS